MSCLISPDEIPCCCLDSKGTPKCRSLTPDLVILTASRWLFFSQPYEFFMCFLKPSCVSDTQGNSQCEGCGAANDRLESLQDQPGRGGEDMNSLALFLSLPHSLFFHHSICLPVSLPGMYFFFRISAVHLSLSYLLSHFKAKHASLFKWSNRNRTLFLL